jgi:CMP/dCMP kinase
VKSWTIALSGELGSGKSSVSERLADALGARRVSTGEAQRLIAWERGISTLELNRLAEADPTIDDEIDSVFRSLASVQEPLVVDSRLAWHFLPDAFKVHLVVDPAEAASRVLHRADSQAERYGSLPEALAKIGDRVESERRRFQAVYGIDIFRLRNYDLVVDTTQASPDEVTERILSSFAAARSSADESAGSAVPVLLLAPTRVYPATDAVGRVTGAVERAAGTDVERLVGEVDEHGFSRLAPITVTYSRPYFFVLDGEERLSAALSGGLHLLPAELQAEDGGPTSDDDGPVPQAWSP